VSITGAYGRSINATIYAEIDLNRLKYPYIDLSYD